MPTEQKLYMVLLGCKPKDRLTEQHDIFFGIAPSLKALVPQFRTFWPQGESNLHMDAWREVLFVDEYKITVCEGPAAEPANLNLFFINLGGYQKGTFDELHYKLLLVAPDSGQAVQKAKAAEFYKTKGFKGAVSHIDDKYEVDDIINVNDLLTPGNFYLHFQKLNNTDNSEDEINIGYFNLDKLKD